MKALAVGVSVALLTAAVKWLLQRRKDPIPDQWLEIGHVDDLAVFPLKSGAAIRCQQINCTSAGPVVGDSRDRVLAIVRDDGSLVTGRDFPLLTQLSAQVAEEKLTLSAAGHEPLTLDLSAFKSDSRQGLQIWKCKTDGVDCGEVASNWVSTFLGTKVRLLYFPDRDCGKSVYPGFLDLPYIRKEDGGIFSDAMSYLLINQSSVRELNSRLESPVVAGHFRPNIVVAGDKLLPYEEDEWEWLKIGDVVFRNIAPCTRCLFTTVDPESGVKSETFEPLKTLRRYRILRDPVRRTRFGSAPVMGAYLGVRVPGVINAGDSVSIPLLAK